MFNVNFKNTSTNHTVGGSKGVRGTRTHPTSGSKFFKFHTIFGKFGKLLCWHPPGELAPQPEGNPGSSTDTVAVLSDFKFHFSSICCTFSFVSFERYLVQMDI